MLHKSEIRRSTVPGKSFLKDVHQNFQDKKKILIMKWIEMRTVMKIPRLKFYFL